MIMMRGTCRSLENIHTLVGNMRYRNISTIPFVLQRRSFPNGLRLNNSTFSSARWKCPLFFNTIRYLGSYDSIFKDKRQKYHKKRQKLKKAVSRKLNDMREDVRTIPNVLTLSRMCSAPILGYLVIHGNYNTAMCLFTLAGITDVLDGYIARRWPSQRSVLGTALDPMADKILVCVLTVSLTIAHLLPAWLTCVIVLRDIALVGASAYTRYTVLPPPKSFVRFCDVTIPTAKIYPSNLSKLNTLLQLCTVGLTLGAPVFGYIDHPYLHVLWYATACTTVASGLGYWIQAKKSFSIIKRM